MGSYLHKMHSGQFDTTLKAKCIWKHFLKMGHDILKKVPMTSDELYCNVDTGGVKRGRDGYAGQHVL